MKRRCLLNAALLIGASCTQQDVTAPATARPTPRSITGPLVRSAGQGEEGVIRLTYEDGRWVDFDLNSNQIRSSNGTTVTDVPGDTLAMLATEAGQEVQLAQAMATNPPPPNGEPPPQCWYEDDSGTRIPCAPEYAQSVPTDLGPEDVDGVGRGTAVLIRLLSLPGAPTRAVVGALPLAGRLGEGSFDVMSSDHRCDSHLSALAVAYSAFYRGESVFKGGAWALSGATTLAVNSTIGWRDVAPSILQDVMIGYADRMINRTQIAALHVIGNSYHCQARSPIDLKVTNDYYNQPGVGQSPIGAGVTSYTRTCADMDVEVSTDGGRTWTTVHVKVCEIKMT